MIAASTINRVRELPIVDVLSHFVQLKRQGANYVCCCPFHGENTPSLSVTPSKNLWHCFGCGKGGDAIAFVQEKNGCDFQQSVEEIAKCCSVPIEYVKSDKTDEQITADKHREAMFITLEQVQTFFIQQLSADNAEAEKARSYAYGRWPQDFCIKAGIGYSPYSSDLFYKFCESKSIDKDILLQLGVLAKGEDGSVYPLLRGRITIPIFNRVNRLTGFTARTIGNSKIKYLNLPNSAVFNKSESVFGINIAARSARDKGFLILVEGAPDVLRLQSVGLTNAVSTLGTAWSGKHFDAIKPLAQSLCFIPDSDTPKDGSAFGAGFIAVMKNGAEAMRRDFDVTVRELPFGTDADGEPTKNDADSFINSTESFYRLQEKHFIVWLAEKKFPQAATLLQTRETVTEISTLLSLVDDRLLVDECIEQLTNVYGKPKMWRDAYVNAKAQRLGQER